MFVVQISDYRSKNEELSFNLKSTTIPINNKNFIQLLIEVS